MLTCYGHFSPHEVLYFHLYHKTKGFIGFLVPQNIENDPTCAFLWSLLLNVLWLFDYWLMLPAILKWPF